MEQNIKKNEDYLKTGLYFMGFTQDLYPALEKAVQEGKPGFSLNETRSFNNREFEYKLNYAASTKNNGYPYEWTGYDVSLKENQEHKVHINVDNNRGITAKESANLLSGLAVGKGLKTGGIERESWTVLDFSKKDEQGNFVQKTFGEGYGFDMKAALKELQPLINEGKPLSADELNNLRKGNMPDVTFTQDGKAQSAFLIVKPEERQIEVYNEEGKLLKEQTGISRQRQEMEEKIAKQPKKMDFIQNNLLAKMPRKTTPALAEAGEEEKKSRKR